MADSFSGLLLRYRGRTRLTQRQLAMRIGVNTRTVQGWESGLMYPVAGRLEALITTLLEAGGFTNGREQQEAEELWAAVEREAGRAHPSFQREWFAALAAGGSSDAREVRAQPQLAADSDARQDWGDAPTLIDFVGRTQELPAVREWVLDEHCRLICLLGMGGIGKTSVAARVAQELSTAFERVYWRGLRNAPPVSDWLTGAITFLSDQRVAPPDGESNQLGALLRLLRERPSLIVLDNFETLLEPGQRDSRYREGLAGYGEVLRMVGESSHRGCIIVTSREAPPEWTMLAGRSARTLELRGLSVPDGQELLSQTQLSGDPADWANLIARYGGNSLALKVVGETIRQVFGGEISAFLLESATGAVFGGIRRLLAEQFERSSPLEQTVLRVLAIEREPVTVAELIAALGPRAGLGALVESIEALRRRSLVERAEIVGAAAFTLQSVVLEYVTDRLVEDVADEVGQSEPVFVVEHPLIQAHAREYVRHSQERLIGAPILHRLKLHHGAHRIEPLLLALLDFWRAHPEVEQGFGPSNIVNLLRLLRGELRGLNLAQLRLGQAYLAGVEAQGASLAHADLTSAVLTETFNFPVSVALSAEGEILVAGTSAGELCVWRLTDRTRVLALAAHTGPVRGVALGADGHLVATGSEDGTIRVWQLPDGVEIATLGSHTTPVYSVALSNDGSLVVGGSFDGTIRLWDVENKQLVMRLETAGGPISSVVLGEDSRLVVSGSVDGMIRFWDVPDRKLLSTLEGHSGPVWSLHLSSDGQLLASGTEDKSVRLWDVSTGRLLHTLEGHTGSIRAVSLTNDGSLVASGSWDQTLRVWDTRDGHPIATLVGHTGPVRGASLSADGKLLASASLDGSVRLWEVPSGRPLIRVEGHTSPVYSVALSGDGELLAGATWDGTIQLWDTRAGQKLATLGGHTSAVYGVALSADGQIAASGSWDRTIRLWRTSNRQLLATLSGHPGGVRSVALTPNGDLLASASWDGTVRLWHVATGRLLTTLRGHTGGVRSVALSADGQIVLSGGLDGTVRLWRTQDGTPLGTMAAQANPVYCVDLSADGQLAVSGGWDGMVRIWDTPSETLLATLQGHVGEVRSVALSRDARLLVSSGFDGTVRLWSTREAQALAVLTEGASPVYGVALSQDGRLLASGSFDGSLRLWDPGTGALLHTLRADRPYERVDVTGVSGLTAAQHAALVTLGAIEHA
ncbi:MAG: hypothetical protein JOZ87_12435 [Chloroflexi bacterium]|nr:hypothetical protein [Chloroflexota bacterium]